METGKLAAARAKYRELRKASRMTAEKFDHEARYLVLELADGEAETPDMWVTAAHILIQTGGK